MRRFRISEMFCFFLPTWPAFRCGWSRGEERKPSTFKMLWPRRYQLYVFCLRNTCSCRCLVQNSCFISSAIFLSAHERRYLRTKRCNSKVSQTFGHLPDMVMYSFIHTRFPGNTLLGPNVADTLAQVKLASDG